MERNPITSGRGITTLAALVLACGLTGCGEQTAPLDQATIDANNQAIGLMGRYEYADAVDIWEPLSAANPDWLDGKVNLAIATLNRQEEGDEDRALALLDDVIAQDTSNIRAQYLSGFLLVRAGQNAEAIDRFMAVVSLDPDDAYGWYHYGVANDEKEPATALLAYEGAVERNPYLRSGWYRLGQIAARLGENEKATRALEVFQKLENNPRGTMVKPVYGRLGPNALAATIDTDPQPTARPEGPAWLAPAPLQEDLGPWRESGGARVPTAVDLDGDGVVELFIAGVGTDDAPNAVIVRDGDGYRVDRDHPLATVPNVQFALFGDLDNDGRADAYLACKGPNVLFMQDAEGTWTNHTAIAEVAGGDFTASDGAIVDIDHDGDLDILVANADGPLDVFANTLNGAFKSIGEETGLAAATNASQLLIADLDHTSDLDVFVVRPNGPNMAFLNDRLWNFERRDEFMTIENSDIVHAVAGDLDASGRVNLFTVEADGSLGMWWFDNRGKAKRKPLEQLPAPPSNLAILDANGDGVLELVTDRSVGLEGVQSWTIYQQDIARGPAIIAVPADGPAVPQLVAPGPGRHAFTGLELSGADDTSQQMRSNAGGIGALVAARRGTEWTIRRNLRHDAGPGQGSQPMVFGLGGANQLDFIRIDWPDGLLQSEIAGVADAAEGSIAPAFGAGDLDRITETQRQVSSCPVLFAFDGESMRFVSDVLGVGGIGYLFEPGVYNTPRPRERFPVPAGALAPDANGQLRMVVCEPMEEVCYLDGVQLFGWQLPEGWSVAIDERMAVKSAQPNGEPIFFRGGFDPVKGVNDRGEDVLSAIVAADFVAAPIGAIDRRFIGRLQGEHVLELEFDHDLGSLANPVLLMDGWVEYPYSQTMFASWQAEISYDAPTLEIRNPDGTWTVWLEQFGYPAGMPRTAAMPLGRLPEGTTAMRLRTNQEIYWDRLRVVDAEAEPAGAVRIDTTLTSADLQAIGYPRRLHLPQRRPDYDYTDRVPLWDVRHQRGLYTDYGDVTDLLATTNDEVVTIGPGEGVTLAFEPAHNSQVDPARPIHWIIDFSGWCKDRDRFTRDGETLEPLPAATPRANRMESGD